jgi:hypothetical protein
MQPLWWMTRKGLLLIVSAAGLASCAAVRDREGATAATAVAPVPPPQPAWRGALKPADLDRLSRLNAAWEEALAVARSAGATRRFRAEGELLSPLAALPRASLPPGSYRCRLIRIGASRRGRGAYTALGPYFCFVGAEGTNLSFVQQTGPDRPWGSLYDDGEKRQILIGSRSRGAEKQLPTYGDRPERDIVGVAERVGNFRYRIVMPWPQSGALLEVMELVPATD